MQRRIQAAIVAVFVALIGLIALAQPAAAEGEQVGGRIDAVFFCPHTSAEQCDCRKPEPGMLREIGKRYNTSLSEVPAVGDSLRDMQVAAAVGAQPMLVLTGNGSKTVDHPELPPQVLVFADLAAAVAHITR